MPHPIVPEHAQPCIWMSAGLMNYKLCDRDFDCERCPLDAALRCGSLDNARHDAFLTPRHDGSVFPEDRLYTTGHTWLQAVDGQDGRLLRFGVDAVAAAMIGRCREIAWEVAPRVLARGETICRMDLQLGVLLVGSPVRGVVVEGNRPLQDEPDRLVTAPYGDGWIVDLRAEDATELDRLLTAKAARERSRLDLRRFRRRVALQLLAGSGGLGPCLNDGGELVVDLRQMLGGPTYLDLLREFVH